jgi:hypothetical protein
MTFLFTMSLMQGQTKQTEKKEIKETKKELKTERVALRKLEGNIVSARAKGSFSVDFPNVTNAVWKRADTFDEVAFTNKNGLKMKAFYDIDGKLVGTTQNKTFADVPASGQNEIKKNYKDYTVGQVIFFDDNEANETDMMLYSTQFDDADNYFVELAKGDKKIVLQVNTTGQVFFFKQL